MSTTRLEIPISLFLSDFYDSVNQRDVPGWRDMLGDDNIGYALSGRMRLDSLLGERLCLVDTQILDGRFFLELMDPTKLENALRRGPYSEIPVQVMSRSDSLEEALKGLVSDRRSGDLKEFSFSTLEEDERLAVTEASKKRTSLKIQSWRDVPAFIESAGVDSETVERLTDSWARWLRAEANGLVQVRPWTGQFDLDAELGDIESVAHHLETDAGRHMLKELWRSRRDRGHVHDVLLPMFRTEAGDDEAQLKDLKELEAWYHRAYWKAAASQHGCSDFESVRDGVLASSDGLMDALELHVNEDLKGSKKVDDLVRLEVRMVDGLGRLSGDKFQALCQSKLKELQNWWAAKDQDDFAKAIEAFTEASMEVAEHTNDKEARQATSEGAVTVGGGALAGLVGFLIGAAVGGPIGAAIVGATGGGISWGAIRLRNLRIDRVQGKGVNRINERIAQAALGRAQSA